MPSASQILIRRTSPTRSRLHDLPVEPVQGPGLARGPARVAMAGSATDRASTSVLYRASVSASRLAARSASTVVATATATNSRNPMARNWATGFLTNLTTRTPLEWGSG